MNSRWKGNLVIFIMTLVPIHSNGRIEIRFSSAPKSQPWVKVDRNLRIAWGLMLEHEKYSFSVILTNFSFWSAQGCC